MCGIVAVVQDESTWDATDIREFVTPELERALAAVPETLDSPDIVASLSTCVRHLFLAEAMLRGVRGTVSIAFAPDAIPRYEQLLDEIWERTEALERALDEGAVPAVDIEALNAAIVQTKDVVWKARRDALRIARVALDLAPDGATPRAVGLFAMVEIALSAIDRVEVRGRDSAGIAVVVRGHGIDLHSRRDAISDRLSDELLRSGSIRAGKDAICFVYKAAAEVGELGDNTRKIRDEIRSDQLLQDALASPDARAVVLGHTRWASVGMISEANAHPLASDEAGAEDGPVVLGVLNGDIDNHADITASEGLSIPREITTDAKIIPVLVSRRLREGLPLDEAFRRTVGSFDGSVAIAAVSLDDPDRVLLALRGSGQALYTGFAENGYLVASEPYGFVEQASVYVRLDGESAANGDSSARGQIAVVREGEDRAGVEIVRYDGEAVSLDDQIRAAEITTRDVDRGKYPHFLLKEMLESPRSFRKTLRGRLLERDGKPCVLLGDDTLPEEVRDALSSGRIRRIVAIGQGSAAIAARALGTVLGDALRPAPIVVESLAATELSGFGLRDDMSDTLVIPISQSGTTADTNRTVEVARARGAWIVSIVNRRHSDLTDRSHGVLYTSDGRDVEMAVPSTKAFYAQVAAGFLLAVAISEHVGGARGVDPAVLEALRDLPDAMDRVLDMRPQIAEIAQRHVPMRRDWAVVGNGANRVAAEEVRIKLSELCYKSISCDVTEDKKHIDLSAEPLILVCAAGLVGSNAEDVAKEIVYYRAHKAAPIVIHGEGEGTYDAALDVIRVPSVRSEVAFVLSTVAGHVFGYEAALVIDALARPLREARTAVEAATEAWAGNGHDPLRLLEAVRPPLSRAASTFSAGLRSGIYDGHLEPSTAVRLASLFRYASGALPLDAYPLEYGKVGTPTEVLRDLLAALTTGIDKLTRPVDAIRHQAKTVTVGISRAEETLLQVRLVREVLATGVARDCLAYGTLRALAALDPSIAEVSGYTLYRVEGDVHDTAQIHVTDRGGVARSIASRTESDPRLRGTKHRVAVEREVLVTRGHDGRTLVMVPEVKGAEVTGIVLLHVTFPDRLPADVMRGVLQGYRDRYSALRDLVTETEPSFKDELLGEIDVADLLIESIQVLARRWRAS